MGVGLCALLVVLQLLQPPGVITGMVRSREGSPAAGVRVYVIPVREAIDVAGGVVLESIAQTDKDGRYRLEAPPGKYYLAVGSVQTPTYYPGVSNITTARVIDITSGSSLEGMDFSSFSPAAAPIDQTTSVVMILRLGEISGFVRYPDGSPLAGNFVIAVPVANAQSPGSAARFRTTTDIAGRYRFSGLLAGSYYIATGYAERPVFFPGVDSLREAKVVTVSASGKIDASIVVPQSAPGVTVHGKVTSTAGVAIEGADVRLVSRNNSGVPVSLPQRPLTRNYTLADGSFELQDIVAGSYDLEVRVSGITPVVRELTVASEPLNGIDVTAPMAEVSGRVVMDGGAALPDVQSIGAFIASTVGNPNSVSRLTFPINEAGEFSRLIEPGRFRVSLEAVPEGYAIVSMESGGVDLLQEDLEVTEATAVRIEVRLARKQ